VIRGRVTGAAELRYVARLVEQQRVAELKKELSKAQRQAFSPLQPAIKTSAAATLPSGYAPVMARAVKVSVRRRGLTTTAEVYARGRRSDRDVPTVDAGRLRHPLFGNRKSWHTTRVRSGFVDRPVKELGERIATESLDALERIGNEITRG
jgi:hypothetical protein